MAVAGLLSPNSSNPDSASTKDWKGFLNEEWDREYRLAARSIPF